MEQQQAPQLQPGVETLSAAEAEKQALEQANKRALDPVEAAETMYQVYLPRFKMLVSRLSAKAMRRLITGIIEVPLKQDVFDGKTKEEKEAFAIGDRLMQAKSMLIFHTLAEYEKSQIENKEQESEGETNVSTEVQ